VRTDPIVPEIVAHRGYAWRYPENTLLAVRAALDCGAAFVEVDVLLSADGVPVLIHDATLARTAGRDEEVAALPWSELQDIEVAERPRLGERGAGETVPSLKQLVALLGGRPAASAFIEIKRAALASFGVERVVRCILEDLAPVRDRAIVISFSADAVERARALGAPRVGWVLERYDEGARAIALRLAPDFLFCNYEKLPSAPTPLWAGRWSWVIYEVTDATLARALMARGVRYVETMAVGEMLAALGARVR
jgi:glycerophosphoryl diester phosphodiesterase